MAKNVKAELKGDVLTLTINLAASHGVSKSGKSSVIATTGGNVEVKPGIFMGVNVYKKEDNGK